MRIKKAMTGLCMAGESQQPRQHSSQAEIKTAAGRESVRRDR
jgi:hypothetical protein